ncbi:D-glycero-beta-D-manno-heptose 1-phosphate adenylyltransferase [Micromonospora sp. WMMD1102]|uniref:D-glycero-beta-D-manno-heptose 1-phosphate adenylyltransferase n=1 Tax=Micromonospora sp. WMMD1102 TaxID=3016105 RepID=UPI0024152CA2|nr:D-glycero-beta-D-manno-heptose 1-phosphate adenylyltransferase [Micromonospora sp. WMMD1102]MDG4790431.1 D-glycero-beta-D-manno-heptose 1-phosphate adenylyltransferase [Micromonospora sp. WMMD1102]
MATDAAEQRRLASVVESWLGRGVLVVGDAMLDEWRFAESDRLCREAPAPVLTLRRRLTAAGGAANTAVNLTALGGRAALVAPVGADVAGDELHDCLDRAGVWDRTISQPGRPTPVKRRLLAADQILLREDEGDADETLPEQGVHRMLNALARATEELRADRDGQPPTLVVCDYGLGALPEAVRSWLVRHRDSFATVALDAHDLAYWRGLAPTVVTPSFAEATRLLDEAVATGPASPTAAVAGTRVSVAEDGSTVAVGGRAGPDTGKDADGGAAEVTGTGCGAGRPAPTFAAGGADDGGRDGDGSAAPDGTTPGGGETGPAGGDGITVTGDEIGVSGDDIVVAGDESSSAAGAPGAAGGRPVAGGGLSRALVAQARLAELRERTGADVVAVTLDAEGAVVGGADGHSRRSHATPVPASYAVGAGDAYLAAMTLALAAGAPLPSAAQLAQLAATTTVSDTGTCVCLREDLLAALNPAGGGPGRTVLDRDALLELVAGHRAEGRAVVFTNGCFDVLHRGHVRYLDQARELGDLLVVAVNSDDSVRRLKGADRPVNPVEDRVAVLAALSCVDHVVVFEEDSPVALIEAIRPDVYVKGGDYPPDMVPEAPLVRRLGGQVRTLGYVPDRSTSAVIDRIRSHGDDRRQAVAAGSVDEDGSAAGASHRA